MAFDAIRKELQRVVCTCYLACPAVALCGGGKVTAACPAVALCEGGKTLPLTDRSEGALTILRSFEIASLYQKSETFLKDITIPDKNQAFYSR